MAHRKIGVKAAIARFVPFLILAVPALPVAALFAFGCCAPDGGKSGRPKLRFEPAERDYRDVAVGELRTDRVALVCDEPFDWKTVQLATSCDCLMADFVGTPTPTRAEVEVTVTSGEVEEALGASVKVEDAKHDALVEFGAVISIRRRPFVQPRELFLAKGPSQRFELIVGQAFPHDAMPETPVLDSLDVTTLDGSGIDVLDMSDLERELSDDSVILRTRIEFTVLEEARAKPFEATIPLSIGCPPQARAVKVHWPGS
jgi:hypothetical protein